MFLQKFSKLKEIIPLLSYRVSKNEITAVCSHKNNIFCLKVLKAHINFKYELLSCISGIDLFTKSYRFCVSYDIISLIFNSRVRLKVFIDEITPLQASIFVYVNANWWEREIWDLYGIYFDKHNDLRRILTDYGFEGHPMRKDFPLYGYTELRYNENKKRVISERVQLTQEFRNFYFETPWQS